jgi:hypothetical protein
VTEAVDPFEGKDDNVTPITKSKTAVEAEADDGTGISITLKGGPGFEVPWVVARYPNVEAAFEDLTDEVVQEQLKGLFDAVADASAMLITKVSAKAPAKPAGQAGGGSRPQTASASPSGETRDCRHGQMTWKSGVSKKGNTYAGWFCPSRDRNDQCDTVWPPK